MAITSELLADHCYNIIVMDHCEQLLSAPHPVFPRQIFRTFQSDLRFRSHSSIETDMVFFYYSKLFVLTHVQQVKNVLFLFSFFFFCLASKYKNNCPQFAQFVLYQSTFLHISIVKQFRTCFYIDFFRLDDCAFCVHVERAKRCPTSAE